MRQYAEQSTHVLIGYLLDFSVAFEFGSGGVNEGEGFRSLDKSCTD